jgi:1-acyl-sn-glycerol-3-phosphate acyltransferase
VIRTCVFYAAAVPLTILFCLLSVTGGVLGAKHSFFDWVHRNWARGLLWVAGVRIDVEGLEHFKSGRPQIIMVNHQSFLDIWALMSVLPGSLRFVAKSELAKIPLVAVAMRAAGHVFIDRGRASRTVDAIRSASTRMREEGLSLVLFPEGTRSYDGKLGHFLRGSFALAIETGAHLVPAAVDGGYAVCPRGSWRISSGTLWVRLAPAVSLSECSSSDRNRLSAETRAAIESMLDRIRDR